MQRNEKLRLLAMIAKVWPLSINVSLYIILIIGLCFNVLNCNGDKSDLSQSTIISDNNDNNKPKEENEIPGKTFLHLRNVNHTENDDIFKNCIEQYYKI